MYMCVCVVHAHISVCTSVCVSCMRECVISRSICHTFVPLRFDIFVQRMQGNGNKVVMRGIGTIESGFNLFALVMSAAAAALNALAQRLPRSIV